MRYSVLIFDLDDTLIESFPEYVRMHQRIAAELDWRVPSKAELVNFGPTWEATLERMWPGRALKSPVAGGFLNIILGIVVAFIAFWAIHAFCNWHFGAAMKYPFNWMTVANVMLAITFPIWAAFSGFFNYWPLPPSPPPPGPE